MRIVVIVPSYNESASVGQVVRAIPRFITDNNDVRVIVVDDGSTDETSSVAHSAGADLVFKHKKNRGIAAAFKSGVRLAIQMGADIIVNIDADGQFFPEEIPMIISPILAGEADVVLGSRFADSETIRKIPLSKRIGNQLVTLLVSLMAGTRFTDTQCGFRAFSGRAAKELDVSGLFTYTQEMILDLVAKGFRVKEVPIKVRYFASRSSRVVVSLPRYASKVIGLILITLFRIHKRNIAIMLVVNMLFLLLMSVLVQLM